MLLRWGAPTSAGARQKRWINYDSFFKLQHPKLATKLVRRTGRSNLGNKTVLSKGKAYATYLYKSSSALHTKSLVLGTVVAIEPQGIKKAASALIKTALGGWYYTTPTQHVTTLSYFGVNNPVYLKKRLNQISWFWQLASIPPHAKICSVHIMPKRYPEYALSPGSSCVLIAPTLWEGWSFLLLPSKLAKLVDSSGWALLGSPSPVFKKNTNYAKAVKYKLTGHKSTVRGVAKNPNDHPHGGRTKAIKYPRTPWGKTAKKSRTPATNIKLKPLSKRKTKLKTNFVLTQQQTIVTDSTTAE